MPAIKSMFQSLEEMIRKVENYPNDYFLSPSDVALFIVNLNLFPDDEGVVKYSMGADCLKELSDETELRVSPGENQLIAVTDIAYYQRTGKKWTPRFRPTATFSPHISQLTECDIFEMSTKKGLTSNASSDSAAHL